MLTYYRITIVKDSKSMRDNSELDTDIVWVEAHNPETAKLMAIRWYDRFIGKRSKKHDVQWHAYQNKDTYRRGQYLLHQWYFFHRLIDNAVIATWGYGTNRDQAMAMSRAYEYIAYPQNCIKKKYFKSEKVED